MLLFQMNCLLCDLAIPPFPCTSEHSSNNVQQMSEGTELKLHEIEKQRPLQTAPASNLDNPIKYHSFFPERHLFPKRLTSALVRQLTQQLKQHKHYGQHVKPFSNTSGFWCFTTIPNPYEEKKRRKQSNVSLKIHYKVISLSLVRR